MKIMSVQQLGVRAVDICSMFHVYATTHNGKTVNRVVEPGADRWQDLGIPSPRNFLKNNDLGGGSFA